MTDQIEFQRSEEAHRIRATPDGAGGWSAVVHYVIPASDVLGGCLTVVGKGATEREAMQALVRSAAILRDAADEFVEVEMIRMAH